MASWARATARISKALPLVCKALLLLPGKHQSPTKSHELLGQAALLGSVVYIRASVQRRELYFDIEHLVNTALARRIGDAR